MRQMSTSERPWPCVMPCSAAPEVVVIGISPGNSPRKEDRGCETRYTAGAPPTFGEPPDFGYPDTKHYWAKVRSLCCHLVRRADRKMSENDCIALSSHLNLGTGQAGQASMKDTDPPLIRWVSTLLNKFFQPHLIVLFGLNRILRDRSVDWNHRDGLQVDWHQPHFFSRFDRYQFRLWNADSAKGNRTGVLMWPNHPSRPPFAGSEKTAEWTRALKEASKFLKEHGF